MGRPAQRYRRSPIVQTSTQFLRTIADGERNAALRSIRERHERAFGIVLRSIVETTQLQELSGRTWTSIVAPSQTERAEELAPAAQHMSEMQSAAHIPPVETPRVPRSAPIPQRPLTLHAAAYEYQMEYVRELRRREPEAQNPTALGTQRLIRMQMLNDIEGMGMELTDSQQRERTAIQYMESIRPLDSGDECAGLAYGRPLDVLRFRRHFRMAEAAYERFLQFYVPAGVDIEEVRDNRPHPGDFSLVLDDPEYEGDAGCPICLENLLPSNEADFMTVRLATCNHRFHWECMRDLLTLDPRCPLCRQSVFQTV